MTFPSATQPILNNRQFLRCISLSKEGEAMLREEVAHKQYCLIEVSLANTHTSQELMKRFASALKFPMHFGGNWDALLDMITDLRWNPASGYVLILKEAEALVQLPSEHFAIFIRLCLAAVERWQSGEDEEGKLIPKTPFYFIFQGEESFCRLLGDLSTSR